MNRTIYIRDADVHIWDKAKEIAGDKLAPVIVEGLRQYIGEHVEQESKLAPLEQRVAALESQLKPIKEIPGSETDCWRGR